jgi:chromosome segregation ATPase
MSTDGLSLEQVQQQWAESQRLIDDLRTRLEALASASTSAAEAATRARESQESLAGLADVQKQVLEKFQELQASAANAVEQLQAASNSNDTSQLMREMSSVADAAGRAAQASSTTSGKVDGLSKDMASRLAEQSTQLATLIGDVAELRRTQTKVADLEERIRALESERDAAQGDLQKAIAAVPGRYANKISDAIGGAR